MSDLYSSGLSKTKSQATSEISLLVFKCSTKEAKSILFFPKANTKTIISIMELDVFLNNRDNLVPKKER